MRAVLQTDPTPLIRKKRVERKKREREREKGWGERERNGAIEH